MPKMTTELFDLLNQHSFETEMLKFDLDKRELTFDNYEDKYTIKITAEDFWITQNIQTCVPSNVRVNNIIKKFKKKGISENDETILNTHFELLSSYLEGSYYVDEKNIDKSYYVEMYEVDENDIQRMREIEEENFYEIFEFKTID